MVLSRSLELQHDLRTQEVEVHVHFRNYIFANQRTRSSSNMLVRELTTVQCMHSLHPMQFQIRPFLFFLLFFFFFSFSTKTFPLSAWNRKKRHQCVRRGDDSDDAANSKEKEMIEMDRLPIWRPEIANYGDSRMTTLCSSLFYFALYILPCALLKKHWFQKNNYKYN